MTDIQWFCPQCRQHGNMDESMKADKLTMGAARCPYCTAVVRLGPGNYAHHGVRV